MHLRFAGELAEPLCARFLIADIVTQGQRLVETGEDRLQGREQTVGAHLIEHLAHPVRLGTRLGQQVALAELDQHAFRAGGDEAAPRGDQELTGGTGWRRRFQQFGGAGFEILDDLVHQIFVQIPGISLACSAHTASCSRDNYPIEIGKS